MTVNRNLIKAKLILMISFLLPTHVQADSQYSGNFQIRYGAVDFHKTDTSIFNEDEAPNYKPFSFQGWLVKKYTSDTDIYLMTRIETYNPHGTTTSSQFTADDTPDLSVVIDGGAIKNYTDYSVEIGSKFIRNRITSRGGGENDADKRPYDYRRLLGVYLNSAVELNDNDTLMGTIGLLANQKAYGRKHIDEIVYAQIFYNHNITKKLDLKISRLSFRSALKDKPTKPDESGHDLDRTSVGLLYDMTKYRIGFDFERYTIRYKIKSKIADGDAFFINFSIPFGNNDVSKRHKLMLENKPLLGYVENMLSGPAE
tara:strand:+ start:1314 stop:2252 length:939 start_codon:yes stop_codon:yes gene_type:complete